MSADRVVVVGASLAGASVAVQLRRLGFDGTVTVVGEEVHPPYERPALSKGYLAGVSGSDELLVHPAGTYEELGIEVRRGCTATSLDTRRRLVLTADGDALPYDALVIATGAHNVVPPWPGTGLRGVHQLRTVDDADALASAARTAERAVVVGMGFIGCEVAATLRGLGLDVTMVDPAPGPLHAQLGPAVSATVAAWHREHGVRMLVGVGVAALEGRDAVEAVVLSDGRRLTADLVVVGVGARPSTGWLRDAPLHLVGGAVGTDSSGRTSVDGVYAAGDVTTLCDRATGQHHRVEHYRSAVDEADRVARALVGADVPAAAPSWFWSDQYGHTLHYAGERRDGDDVHARPDGSLVHWVRGGVLTAVAAVDAGRDFRRALRRLGTRVDAASLVAA